MADETPINPTEFVAPTLEELTPLFPAYELESFIAQGGMGAVYKARQKSLDRAVAIKILPREFGDDPQFRASFEAEAKAMARLNHPNLISVYDFGDIDGMLFIIMEFVQGKALYYSAHKKAISPDVAIPLVATVLRGLAHAHKGGIIHRDIKPANILLDIDATPKIGDFGLARPADLNDGEGVVFGTPGYTAPEIFHRQPVDERSDVFSVGAMLYELLSGKAPEANSSQLSSGVDPRIDAIIKKATHSDPQLRHSSADELADELDKLTTALKAPKPAISSPVNVPVVTSGKSSSTGPVLVTLLAILLGGGALAYFFTKDKKEDPAVTESPAPSKEKDADKKPKKKAKQKKEDKKRPEKMAQVENSKPETPAPEDPEPRPEPKPETSKNERPLASLTRLREKLSSGDRSEFPPSSIERNGSQFLFIPRKFDWAQASRLAQSHGAQLAVLTTLEDLEWAQETFQPSTALWLGASDSGMEGKWHWNEGQTLATELWTETQPDDTPSEFDGEDFVALSAGKASLEDLPKDRELPILIEWKLDGSTPGSLDSQLTRAGAALASKKAPIFPTGTRNIGGSRFLYINQRLTWSQAKEYAEKAGGHLAVASNEEEAQYIKDFLSPILTQQFQACWLGGLRTSPGASTWTTVTGERFAFIDWAPRQPDNSHNGENHLNFCNLFGEKAHNDGSDDPRFLFPFLIEWSHPSMRNMPEEGEVAVSSDPLADALELVREDLRAKHGRGYARYHEKKTKIIHKFTNDAIQELEDVPSTAAEAAERGIDYLTGIKETLQLPEEFPAGFGERLGKKFADTKEKVEELQGNYFGDREKAVKYYRKILSDAVSDATKEGDEDKAQYLAKEIELASPYGGRLSNIFRKRPVDPPLELNKAPVNGEIQSLYQGRWSSFGSDDEKIVIILRSNNSANLKTHGGGVGKWEVRQGHANIEINGYRIQVTPTLKGLQAVDQEGNEYLLMRQADDPNVDESPAILRRQIKQHEILGRWRHNDKRETVFDFKPDGTVTTASAQGKWKPFGNSVFVEWGVGTFVLFGHHGKGWNGINAANTEFHIFRADAVEPIVTDEKERRSYLGRWESDREGDRKVIIDLLPDGSATSKGQITGQGNWQLFKGRAIIKIKDHELEVKPRPAPDNLRVLDQDGHRYMLDRIK